MALAEEFEKEGNWLFRWRGFLPLVLYVLAVPVIVFGLDDHMNAQDPRWMIICLAVALLGLVIRGIAIGIVPKGTSGRNTHEGQVAEVLNSSGIYSVVRHPLYLGNFFMWNGIVLYVGNWWFTAVCVLLFWLYYERIMFAEEQFLRKKFGKAYLDWSNYTPPFFPKLSGWKKSTQNFSLRNVLKREYSGFFAIFISFAFLDILRNFIQIGEFQLQDFWLYALAVSFVIMITLRTLKKTTRILHVEGR